MAKANGIASKELILSDVKGFFSQESAKEEVARLDEPSLRSLRESLHSQLVEEMPVVAGRPLTKRMPGNVTKLVDDCWAFGTSLAQAVLLKEADCVLKPPNRRVPTSILQSSSATQTSSADIESMEALLDNMLRLDREIQELRASDIKMKAVLSAQQDRITSLEEQHASWRDTYETNPNGNENEPAPAAPAAAFQTDRPTTEHSTMSTETKPPTLPNTAIGEDRLPGSTDLSATPDVRPTSVKSAKSTPSPVRKDASGADEQTITVTPLNAAPFPTDDAAAPVTEREQASSAPHPGSAPTSKHRPETQDQDLPVRTASNLAAEIARSVDIDRLAGAIVAQMKQHAGPSPGTDCEDSDSDSFEQTTHSKRERPSSAKYSRPAGLPPPCAAPQRRNMQSRLDRRDTGPCAVTGAGDAGTIKVMSAAPETVIFVLEGVHPDTPDSTVHNVVSTVVHNLNGFQKRESSGNISGKSYVFSTENCDERIILDHANWPLGLQVRKMELTDKATDICDTSVKYVFESDHRHLSEQHRPQRRNPQQRRKQWSGPRHQNRQQGTRQPAYPDTWKQRRHTPQARQQRFEQHQTHHWQHAPRNEQLQRSAWTGLHQEEAWRRQLSPQARQQSSEQRQTQQWQQPYGHQQQLQPQGLERPAVWQATQPPFHVPQCQQQQFQQQEGGEPRGQDGAHASLFRAESWPSLPIRQEPDWQTWAAPGVPKLPVSAAAHGNGGWSAQ